MSKTKQYYLITEAKNGLPLYVCNVIGDVFRFTADKDSAGTYALDYSSRCMQQASELGIDLVCVETSGEKPIKLTISKE
ncbi:MAG: hypothetical protein HAW67_00620 [Endozoicomonadaceae bacterium]|nr:hypothetical protein [Endozoicomonadaceae bacterium]